jgi:iron complex transport system ATP-binding protein
VRLAARDLAIGYTGKPVGRGISFEAGPGDVLCLLGPNGSGKTTLFRTLLGLIPLQGGDVALDGDPIGRLDRAEIARRAAYVPQAHVAPFAFSAEEIVVMGRTARLGAFAQPGAEDRQAARAALERLGIIELAAGDYTRLSGGQRQLVLIARALAQEAPVIVMDEPTASLDFGNQALVIGEIARLAAAGLTVILSTHDPDHAFAIGTGVLLLHQGRIAAQGSPDDVLTPPILSSVYGVPIAVEQVAGGRSVCIPRHQGAGAI